MNTVNLTCTVRQWSVFHRVEPKLSQKSFFPTVRRWSTVNSPCVTALAPSMLRHYSVLPPSSPTMLRPRSVNTVCAPSVLRVRSVNTVYSPCIVRALALGTEYTVSAPTSIKDGGRVPPVSLYHFKFRVEM